LSRVAKNDKVNQASAPDSILIKTVGEIPKGAQAMVTPEALVVGDDKKCWLNKLLPTVTEDSGVVVHYMKDGSYEVEIKDSKLRWIKVPVNDDMRKVLLPVSRIHVPDKKSDKKAQP
jgi:hypothetical protein